MIKEIKSSLEDARDIISDPDEYDSDEIAGSEMYIKHIEHLFDLIKRQHEVINSVSPLIKEFAEWERENGTLHQGFMGTINADIISEIVSEWAGNEASRRICDQINNLKEIEGD